jgi:hypothetical protein
LESHISFEWYPELLSPFLFSSSSGIETQLHIQKLSKKNEFLLDKTSYYNKMSNPSPDKHVLFRYLDFKTQEPSFKKKPWKNCDTCQFLPSGQLTQPCASCANSKPRSFKWREEGCYYEIISRGVPVGKGKVSLDEMKAASARLAAQPRDPREPVDDEDGVDWSQARPD